MTAVSEQKKLRFETLTDNFIHDARNALYPSVAGQGLVDWRQEDFERDRQSFAGFRHHYGQYGEHEGGDLTKEQIENFITCATSQPWDYSKVKELITEFKTLIGEKP